MAKWVLPEKKQRKLVKHVKTGNVYEILYDDAMEVTGDEGIRSVVYKEQNGASVYVQNYERFFDGRFETIG